MDAESVIEQIRKLSPEEQRKVWDYMKTEPLSGPPEADKETSLRRRKAGLHPGAMEMAADFDAPLPDEFWFGGGSYR